MKIETISVENLSDNVALITEDGKGISKNDFIDQVKEGWLSYLISLPLTNTIVEQVAVTTNKNEVHINDGLSDALEYFQDYKGEDLSENELSLVSVGRIII